MSQLRTLENFVVLNPGITLTYLQEQGSTLVRDIDFSTRNFGGLGSMMNESPAGIPSFFWGCILGPMGIILVYLMTEDNDETKKAFWGFLTALGSYAVVSILIYVGYFLIYPGYFVTYY